MRTVNILFKDIKLNIKTRLYLELMQGGLNL
jgi:hypothetical protein